MKPTYTLYGESANMTDLGRMVRFLISNKILDLLQGDIFTCPDGVVDLVIFRLFVPDPLSPKGMYV